MQINSNKISQNKSPNFGARVVKPELLNKVPYASIPLALTALATLGLAKISLDKKEDNSQTLLSADEFEQALIKMKKNDGSSRFEECDIKRLKLRYDEFPVILSKMTNLKSKDSNFVFNNVYDILNATENYEKHPEFSEYVIEEIKNSNILEAWALLTYLNAKTENSDLLYRLYNRRNGKTPVIPGYYADIHAYAYEKYPEFCGDLLETKNNEGKYIFGTNEIPNICNAYEKDPKLTKELINISDIYGNKSHSPFIEKMLSFEPEKRDFYIELLKSGNHYYRIEEICHLREKNPELINKLISSKDVYGSCPFDTSTIKDIYEIEDNKDKQNYIINLIMKGIHSYDAIKFASREDANIIYDLLEKGISLEKIKRAIKCGSLPEFAQEVVIPKTALSEFFKDPNYMDKIKENSAGKYQKELIRLFEADKMPYKLYSKLVNSDLSVEDFLASLKKISKSSFKLTYDTPNQYLPGLSTALSTAVNGHYPKLNEYELAFERTKVIDFYVENFVNLAKILKYVDNDTVNHMMDKRFKIFSNELGLYNKIPEEKLELMNKLLQCKSEKTDKPLTVKEKLQICEIVKIFHLGDIDCQYLKNATDKGVVDIDKLKNIILNNLFTKSNVNIAEINSNDSMFNKEYLHLLLISSTRDLETEEDCENFKLELTEDLVHAKKDPENLKRQRELILEINNNIDTSDKNSREIFELGNKLLAMIDNIEEIPIKELVNAYIEYNYLLGDFYSAKNEIYTLINGAFSKDFKHFIHNPENKYGKANLETKRIFAEKDLNHDQWLNTDLEEANFEITGKNLSIKLWDRNPIEDVFMGNKTTCCTAIGRTNGGSTPVYIMGECWNVVQMYDEKGDLVGMSRIFVGENNGECSIMMDNIELNNNFIKDLNDKDKTKIRNEFFKYIHQFAEKIIGKKDAKVYFYRGDTHVNTDDLSPIDLDIEFVGKNPTNLIYINSACMRWINPENFKNQPTEWFEVPKQ